MNVVEAGKDCQLSPKLYMPNIHVAKTPIQLFYLFFSLLVWNNTSAQSVKPLASQLDTVLERMVKESGEAGLALAVVKGNSVLYMRGFGFRDVEHHLPVTPQTIFPIASCTKAFTAALIGSLGEKISLDVPLLRYLPDLRFATTALSEEVTVRDLLCHRSGLPSHDYSWYYMATSSRDSMLQRLAYLEPSARIGERWQYSNWGYFVVAMAAQKLLNTSYESAVEQRILNPLQLTNTFFSFIRLLHEKERAIGYKRIGDTDLKSIPYHPMEAMAPAGGLNSTVVDMAHWLSAWIKGNTALFSASFRTQALSSQIVEKANLPSADKPDIAFSSYGFGWNLSSYRGHYRVDHGGNLDGFASSACFFPTDSIGIVVLCNTDGSLLPAIIRNVIADKVLQLLPYDWHGEEQERRRKKRSAPVDVPIVVSLAAPTHPVIAYTGWYAHPGYGRFEIAGKGDSLFALLGNYRWWLQPLQYDSFLGIEWVPGEPLDLSQSRLSLQFALNLQGEVESITIPFEPIIAPIRFVKELQTVILAPQFLAGYTGDYLISGINASITYDEKKGTLSLILQGQSPYTLQSLEEDVFTLNGLKGYRLRFLKERTNIVSSFIIQQPNGTFKAVRKTE